MTPDLAQEELQRVGGRLQHLRAGERGRRLLLPVDDLDPALLELLVQRLDVAGLEIEQLERLAQLDGLDDTGRVGALQQRLQLIVLTDDRAFVGHWAMSEAGSLRDREAGCRRAYRDTLPVAAAKSSPVRVPGAR